MSKKKILVSGDVKGNFQPLLKRLKKFDFCICMGQTLLPNSTLSELLSGKVVIPKPIYFIDSGPMKHALSISYPEGAEIAPNLHYLGNFGVREVQGFRICFLSGTENLRKLEKRPKEREELLDMCNIYAPDQLKTAEIVTKAEPVDILLTSEWPDFGLSEPAGGNSEPSGKPKMSSMWISELNIAVTPRYHFAGGNNTHFEKKPFINYSVESLKPLHVCRFIALADVPKKGEKSNGKYLYGLATSPIKALDEAKLAERPEDLIENPFFGLILGREEATKESKLRDSEKIEGAKVGDSGGAGGTGEGNEGTEKGGDYSIDAEKLFGDQVDPEKEGIRLRQIAEMEENVVLEVTGFRT